MSDNPLEKELEYIESEFYFIISSAEVASLFNVITDFTVPVMWMKSFLGNPRYRTQRTFNEMCLGFAWERTVSKALLAFLSLFRKLSVFDFTEKEFS